MKSTYFNDESRTVRVTFGVYVYTVQARHTLNLVEPHFPSKPLNHFFFSMMSSSWALFSLLPALDPK
jgi:hypothetical protein